MNGTTRFPGLGMMPLSGGPVCVSALAVLVPSSLIGAGFLKGAVTVKGGACALTK
jgi:hypothetical protein